MVFVLRSNWLKFAFDTFVFRAHFSSLLELQERFSIRLPGGASGMHKRYKLHVHTVSWGFAIHPYREKCSSLTVGVHLLHSGGPRGGERGAGPRLRLCASSVWRAGSEEGMGPRPDQHLPHLPSGLANGYSPLARGEQESSWNDLPGFYINDSSCKKKRKFAGSTVNFNLFVSHESLKGVCD